MVFPLAAMLLAPAGCAVSPSSSATPDARADSTGGATGAGGSSAGAGGARAVGGAAGALGGAGAGGTTGSGQGGVGGGAGGMAGANIGTGGRNGAGGAQSGAGGGGAGSTGQGGLTGLLVPAQGALLGAFVGTGTVPQLETTLGRRLAINHNFFGWTDDFTTWARTTAAGGATPLITWETWVNSVGIPLDDIINGVYDTMIRTRAQASLAIGQPFFLRWGHEMNGNWYPWDGALNGANAAATAKYIATYHHIHDIFTTVGATNVLWVFCPNVDSIPGDAWNQWSNYYPGDAYVDWMGFDGYNWGTVLAGGSWRLFTNIADTIYGGLAAKGKPIMIAETASAELGGDKAAWIATILPAMRASYPAIKALVWFDMNKETDWRVDSSPQSLAAFLPMANDPYFNPR